MSTPRTDVEAFWLELREVVDVDFARELERENAALRADNQAAHALVSDLRAKEHSERTLAVKLEKENAALRADLDWLDKHLDSFACQQLFGEEQDIGKLREMIAKERKLKEKL